MRMDSQLFLLVVVVSFLCFSNFIIVVVARVVISLCLLDFLMQVLIIIIGCNLAINIENSSYIIIVIKLIAYFVGVLKFFKNFSFLFIIFFKLFVSLLFLLNYYYNLLTYIKFFQI